VTEHHRVVIIGAGLGGIATAIALLEDGVHDFVVLEQAPAVGGTWYHNRYPGAECDVKSHLYSFSFELNPRWTRRYARQPEILAYIEGVVEKYGVTPHLRLSTAVLSMRWDDERHCWRVATAAGDVTADFVVSAVGMFNEPVWPAIEGLDRFQGRLLHTARWPEGELLEGQRVAVIGSAASAVQLVPELAPHVDQLHVFQRTPIWVLPKEDDAYTAEELETFARDRDAIPVLREELTALVNRTMTFGDEEICRRAAEAGMRNLEQVVDPELRRRLTPTLPWGSRRPVVSNVYYPAFNRPNVHLVTDPIAQIEAGAVVTRDGTTRPVDVIVCATGFAVTKYLSVIDVTGRGGRSLADEWADEPRAYLGVVVPGFPNLVMMYGPNTNNGSILTMLEAQAEFAVRWLRWMTDHGVAAFDIRPEVVDDYNEGLQRDLDAVEVWQAQPDGYYRGRSGRIVTQWPLTMSDYRERLRAIEPSLFEITVAEGARS
jgi:cation diffusion facilitator CzcD-associated flavoprotein CzcO